MASGALSGSSGCSLPVLEIHSEVCLETKAPFLFLLWIVLDLLCSKCVNVEMIKV